MYPDNTPSLPQTSMASPSRVPWLHWGSLKLSVVLRQLCLGAEELTALLRAGCVQHSEDDDSEAQVECSRHCHELATIGRNGCRVEVRNKERAGLYLARNGK